MMRSRSTTTRAHIWLIGRCSRSNLLLSIGHTGDGATMTCSTVAGGTGEAATTLPATILPPCTLTGRPVVLPGAVILPPPTTLGGTTLPRPSLSRSTSGISSVSGSSSRCEVPLSTQLINMNNTQQMKVSRPTGSSSGAMVGFSGRKQLATKSLIHSHIKYPHCLVTCVPRKHKTFVSHLYNVGPTSETLGRHCTNVIQMFCVCWVKPNNSKYLLTKYKMSSYPANTNHLYNICTMLDQRRRRWPDVVQMLYTCFMFVW